MAAKLNNKNKFFSSQICNSSNATLCLKIFTVEELIVCFFGRIGGLCPQAYCPTIKEKFHANAYSAFI